MADLPPDPESKGDTGDDARVSPDDGSPTSTPRWVKVFAIIVFVLVLLIIIVMFTGGGDHGPSRHGLSDNPVDHITSMEQVFQ